jgi:hypothetical protein
MCIDERTDGRGSLCDERAIVEERRRFETRAEIDRHGRTAEGAEARERLLVSEPRLVVAEEHPLLG